MSFYELDPESTLERAQQLAARDRDGTKQTEKVSDHGPGPVADDELLARSLEFPARFDEKKGGLNETLFQDAFSHGASAQRLLPDWVTQAPDVHTRFEARAQTRREGTDGRSPVPNNLYVGAFQMTAGELRACMLEDGTGPRVRVYDAGEQSDHLHAEVIVDATGLGKPQRKELRIRLMKLAERRGLFVSPYLSGENMKWATETQCELHAPVAEQPD